MATAPENAGVPTASIDSIGRAADDALRDVDVVNHEIEHDVHVGAPFFEGCESLTLDEARAGEFALRGDDHRIEAFEMTDLQDTFRTIGERDQFAGLLDGLGDRLLDKHARPRAENRRQPRNVRASW
jgi:hypothetical protein